MVSHPRPPFNPVLRLIKTKLGLGEEMVPNGNGFLALLVSLSLSLTPDATLQNTQSKGTGAQQPGA
jgi:hypothetical protein